MLAILLSVLAIVVAAVALYRTRPRHPRPSTSRHGGPPTSGPLGDEHQS